MIMPQGILRRPRMDVILLGWPERLLCNAQQVKLNSFKITNEEYYSDNSILMHEERPTQLSDNAMESSSNQIEERLRTLNDHWTRQLTEVQGQTYKLQQNVSQEEVIQNAIFHSAVELVD